MNIEKIKNMINSNKNKEIYFKFNGNRNQIEKFYGTIINDYKYVFLVKMKDKELVRSFSYSDVLIGNLELSVK